MELEHGDLLWVRDKLPKGGLGEPELARYVVDDWGNWLTFFGSEYEAELDEFVIVCKFGPPVPVIE